MTLRPGEIFVLAGETGSGKSLLARLIVGAAGPQVKPLGGAILFEGRDLLRMRARDLQQVRRSSISMVTGDSIAQVNPDGCVRQWLRDCLRLTRRPRELASEKAWSDYFHSVGIVEPEEILSKPMGELSSMLLKRLLVMKAIISRSRLLICDEATSGLDRIAEAQFIELLCQIRGEFGLSILMTLGSLRGVERFADQVAVFYEGGILEAGPARELLESPQFAYTREFRACEPRLSDLPRELPTISREAAREAEEAIHEASSSLDGGAM
jgi:ABC-type dipeptide/oligopeptide/nickel transport system ATPase component